jgi:hypothetical protein
MSNDSHQAVSVRRFKRTIESTAGGHTDIWYREFSISEHSVVCTICVDVDRIKSVRDGHALLPYGKLIAYSCSRLLVSDTKGLINLLSLMFGRKSCVDSLVFWVLGDGSNFNQVVERIGKLFNRKRVLHVVNEKEVDRRIFRVLRESGFRRIRGTGLMMAGGVGRFAKRNVEVWFD